MDKKKRIVIVIVACFLCLCLILIGIKSKAKIGKLLGLKTTTVTPATTTTIVTTTETTTAETTTTPVSTDTVTEVLVPTESFSLLPETFTYLSVDEANITGDVAEKRLALYVAANIKGADFTLEKAAKTVTDVDTYNQILNKKIGIFLETGSLTEVYLKDRIKQGFIPVVKLMHDNGYAIIYGYKIINNTIKFDYFHVINKDRINSDIFLEGIESVVAYINVMGEFKNPNIYDFYYYDITLHLAKERSEDSNINSAMWALSSEAPMYKYGDKWYTQVSKDVYDILKGAEQ